MFAAGRAALHFTLWENTEYDIEGYAYCSCCECRHGQAMDPLHSYRSTPGVSFFKIIYGDEDGGAQADRVFAENGRTYLDRLRFAIIEVRSIGKINMLFQSYRYVHCGMNRQLMKSAI